MGCHMGMVTVVAMRTTINVGVKMGMKLMVVAKVPAGSCMMGIISIMGIMAGNMPGKVNELTSLLSLQVAPRADIPEPTIRVNRTP